MEDTTIEETFSRDILRKIATDPILTTIINRVKANALIGNLVCEYSIPDTYTQITVECLIKLLKPKLPDVTIMQIGPRSIQFDWS